MESEGRVRAGAAVLPFAAPTQSRVTPPPHSRSTQPIRVGALARKLQGSSPLGTLFWRVSGWTGCYACIMRFRWGGTLGGLGLVASLVGGCSAGSPGSIPPGSSFEHTQVGLSDEDVSTLLEQRGAQVQSCYREGLSRQPGLRGSVAVALDVATDGSIRDAKVDRDELGDPRVAPCVARALLGGRLAAQRRPPGPMKIAFDFEPSGGEGVHPGMGNYDAIELPSVQAPDPPFPKGAGPSAPRRP